MATIEEIKEEIHRQAVALNGGKEITPLQPWTHNGLPVYSRKEQLKGHCYLFKEIKDDKTFLEEYFVAEGIESDKLYTSNKEFKQYLYSL